MMTLPASPISMAAVLAAPLLLLDAPAAPGPLQDYVQAPDPHFAWKAGRETNTGTFRITQLELTSQKWREHVWKHQLQVVRPANVRNPGLAFLFVTGDGDGRSNLGLLRLLAERAGALAAVLDHLADRGCGCTRAGHRPHGHRHAEHEKAGGMGREGLRPAEREDP